MKSRWCHLMHAVQIVIGMGLMAIGLVIVPLVP